jgi:hypothetical protein
MVVSKTHTHASAASFLSTVLSRIFDPFIVLAGVTGWSIWKSSLPVSSKYLFMGVVFGVMILPPVLLLAWAVFTKRISNWDISNRSQRPLALFIVVLLGFVNILIVQAFGNRSLTNLFIIYQVWMAGFLGITLLYKISGHTGTLALAAGLLVLRFDMNIWYMVAALVVLGTARVVRKNHTPAQVVLGALYSWGILLFSRSVGLL